MDGWILDSLGCLKSKPDRVQGTRQSSHNSCHMCVWYIVIINTYLGPGHNFIRHFCHG